MKGLSKGRYDKTFAGEDEQLWVYRTPSSDRFARHTPHPAGNASDGLPCYSYRIIESCHFVYTLVTPRGG